MEKKKIYIIGGSRGCGATFAAERLALAMGRVSDGVTYLEGADHGEGHGLPYYELSLDKMIPEKRFKDVFAVKRGERSPEGFVNLWANVNWAVRTGKSPTGTFVMPYEAAGRYIIWDNPGPAGAAGLPDLAIVVTDTLPSRVIAAAEKVRICRGLYQNRVLWIVNRGQGQAVRDTEKFLGFRADFVLRNEPWETICLSEREGPLFSRYTAKESKNTEREYNDRIFGEMADYILTLF